jgi:predicted ribosome quality control (RQC) complex YloA/Tae2 family protein
MNLKNKLKKKYLKIEKKGLVSYAKYLDKEWETSKNKKRKKKYSEYIAKEITRCKKRLSKLKKQLA